MSGPASGGAYLDCAWHQGCSTTFYGSAFTNTAGARFEAREEGWLVGMDGGRPIGYRRTLRLDYCPAHARRERERRGLGSGFRGTVGA